MAVGGQLHGSRELKARLRAIRVAFKPIGKKWAEGTRDEAKHLVAPHNRTGRLYRSIKVRNASQRRATVAAHFTATFLDKGTKAHVIRARKAGSLVFTDRGQTIFAKKVNHPRTRGIAFALRAARKSLRETRMAETLIEEWNKAA